MTLLKSFCVSETEPGALAYTCRQGLHGYSCQAYMLLNTFQYKLSSKRLLTILCSMLPQFMTYFQSYLLADMLRTMSCINCRIHIMPCIIITVVNSVHKFLSLNVSLDYFHPTVGFQF